MQYLYLSCLYLGVNLFVCFSQMKSPAITTTLDGKNKTLYLQVKMFPNTFFVLFWISIKLNVCLIYCYWVSFQTVASIEERTRPNLSKTLKGN